jgi:SAM-dependent methyltransferase
MKIRDSGMPAQHEWEAFFDAPAVLARLQLPRGEEDVVDFGCGYGTFSIAAARQTLGVVYALDIEAEMVRLTNEAARQAGLTNIRAIEQDFMTRGSGRPASSAGCAMLFNVLHVEEPTALLREAYRVLGAGGIAAIVHWIPDSTTPRGPELAIRPRPQQCQAWARDAGFAVEEPVVRVAPFHFGVRAHKLG